MRLNLPTVDCMTDVSPSQVKVMSLRYAGTCSGCGVHLAAGTMAAYDRTTKTVACVACASPAMADVPFEAGSAGASARRKFDHLHAQREDRIRKTYPHLGGAILALTDDPQSTRAWDVGAQGEEVVSIRLDKAVGPNLRVLHDRRIPGSKANIDHIAVGPRGVFVIDAKHYSGAPTHRVSGGLFGPRVEKLMVGSRDQTKLVAGALRQMDLVMGALERAQLASISTFGMLCFVEANWPLLGGNFTINDVEVLWPRKAVSRVTSSGALGPDEIEQVHRALAMSFAPA